MFYDTLKGLRIQRGWTQEELAKRASLSKSTISMYENGNRKPGHEQLLLFAGLFDVDMNCLIGTPEMQATAPDKLPLSLDEILRIPGILPMPEMRKIPMLGTAVCSGPILAECNIEKNITLPTHVVADFALRFTDNSAAGSRIQNGDIVYIRRQPQVQSSQIAAVVIAGEVTLKYAYPSPNQLILTPVATTCEPLIFIGDDLENVRILGRAVAFTSVL